MQSQLAKIAVADMNWRGLPTLLPKYFNVDHEWRPSKNIQISETLYKNKNGKGCSLLTANIKKHLADPLEDFMSMVYTIQGF